MGNINSLGSDGSLSIGSSDNGSDYYKRAVSDFTHSIHQLNEIFNAEGLLDDGDGLPTPDALKSGATPRLSENDINTLMQEFAVISVKLAREMRYQQTLSRQHEKNMQIQSLKSAADEAKTAADESLKAGRAQAGSMLASAGVNMGGGVAQGKFNSRANTAQQKANDHGLHARVFDANPHADAVEANAAVAGHRQGIVANEVSIGLHQRLMNNQLAEGEVAPVGFDNPAQSKTEIRRLQADSASKRSQMVEHQLKLPEERRVLQAELADVSADNRASANGVMAWTQSFANFGQSGAEFGNADHQSKANQANARGDLDKADAENFSNKSDLSGSLVSAMAEWLQRVNDVASRMLQLQQETNQHIVA